MTAEWRYKKSEIHITRDTVIPELPAKPLEEPNDAAYHSHQVQCDERIEALIKEQKDIELERRNKIQEMNGDFRGKSGFSKEFKE